MQIEPGEHGRMLSMMRAPRVARPWLQLLNAVLALAGEHAVLLSHREAAWSSVTFAGTRHTIALEFTGDEGIAAAESFIEALPDHEFMIPHKLIADAAIASVDHVMVPTRTVRINAELLLLDDV
jgi:hypothetical protein